MQILIVLIVAAIVSIILGSIPATSEHPEQGWFDGVAILFAVLIVVGVCTLSLKSRIYRYFLLILIFL